eukprot:gene14358-18328_t
MCPPGEYSNRTATHVCSICPPGSYSPQNSTQCTLCPINTYSSGNGTVECDHCSGSDVNGLPGSITKTDCVN